MGQVLWVSSALLPWRCLSWFLCPGHFRRFGDNHCRWDFNKTVFLPATLADLCSHSLLAIFTDDRWCCKQSVQKRATFLWQTNDFLGSLGHVLPPPHISLYNLYLCEILPNKWLKINEDYEGKWSNISLDRHVHIIYLTFLREEFIRNSSAISLRQMQSGLQLMIPPYLYCSSGLNQS